MSSHRSPGQSLTDAPFSITDSITPQITVTRDVLPRAIRNGMELWWDGSTPTKRLDDRGDLTQFSRFVNARVEGKLSEVAFMQFLEEEFQVRSAVDWRIYGDYEVTDDGDLQYLLDSENNQYNLSSELDIKKTKPYNQWLAVRDEIFRKIDDDAPVVLTKHRIEPDIDVDRWADAGDWDNVDADEQFRERLLAFAEDVFPLQVELTGTAYPDEFTDHFEKGERLYRPPNKSDKIGPSLKRPNTGIHVDNLKNSPQRWNRIVADLIGEQQIGWNPMPVVEPTN